MTDEQVQAVRDRVRARSDMALISKAYVVDLLLFTGCDSRIDAAADDDVRLSRKSPVFAKRDWLLLNPRSYSCSHRPSRCGLPINSQCTRSRVPQSNLLRVGHNAPALDAPLYTTDADPKGLSANNGMLSID